jgi:hypothetical protein
MEMPASAMVPIFRFSFAHLYLKGTADLAPVELAKTAHLPYFVSFTNARHLT